ncbi:hypothetical protein NDU88_002238 [Pleurodeles waltl]|uniref:Uncharacterized protein n=1 Tax=Pleurodeles waltl TaxID=8319 RepID=A0AAV7T268_PLEWA|nr:hypothetical protein NDU88_002238 [Pleurodeles waltl]
MYRAAVSHIEVGSMEEEVAWGRIGASGAGRCGDTEVASWACKGPGPSSVPWHGSLGLYPRFPLPCIVEEKEETGVGERAAKQYEWAHRIAEAHVLRAAPPSGIRDWAGAGDDGCWATPVAWGPEAHQRGMYLRGVRVGAVEN